MALLALAIVGGLGLSACGQKSGAGPPEGATPEAAAGFAVAQQFGCTACHSTNGSPRSGPSFKALAGSTVTLSTGQTVMADDAYLRRAILDPDTDVRKGYSKGLMSSALSGRRALTEQQATELVAYINSLR